MMLVHPDAEDLALFHEGKLDSERRAEVLAHLSTCADCRLAVETAAEIEGEEQLGPGEENLRAARRRDLAAVGELALKEGSGEPRSSSRRWLPAAAAVLVAIVVVWAGRQWVRSRDPLTQLAAAAPKQRPIEPRLTGFAYAPLKPTYRSGERDTPSDEYQFEHTARALLEKHQHDTSIEGLHMRGVAHLSVREPTQAVEALERAAAGAPKDAKIHSDLAAALLAKSRSTRNEGILPRATMMASKAVELDPNLLEAYFNRALILEDAGYMEEARRAWTDYLQRDTKSRWREEAQKHLDDLLPPPSAATFERDLQRALAAHRDGSDSMLLVLARRAPERMRREAEERMLGVWAAAVQEKRNDDALRALGDLRAIAIVVSEVNGERMLFDIVAAIDAAARDGPRTVRLADAYATYDTALRTFERTPTSAEAAFRKAAALLDRVRSPLATQAICYVAHSLFHANDVNGAKAVAQSAAARLNRERHRALAWRIEWQLALCAVYRGSWNAALEHQKKAREILLQLGEAPTAAFLETVIADTYSQIGEIDEGWRRRAPGLRALSNAGSSKIATAATGAVIAEISRRDFETALTLTTLAIEYCRREKEMPMLAETLLRRTNILMWLGSRNEAIATLPSARAAASAIADGKIRERVERDIDVVEAKLDMNLDPRRSIALLDSAVQFYSKSRFSTWLPSAYLERGRARRAAGDDAGALADFQSGIRELEAQRSDVTAEYRAQFFDTEPDLFAEMTSLLLDRGDVSGAFATIERARARTLHEKLGLTAAAQALSPTEIYTAIGPDRLVIEYAILSSGLAIFCVDARGITVVRRKATSAQLQEIVAAFMDSIQTTAPEEVVQKHAANAWRLLLEPVIDRIASAERITIVPDRFLNAVSFAALFDPGKKRYLAETHVVTVAPSAAFLARKSPSVSLTPALVIGDPAGEGEALYVARREARAVAAMYPPATLLLDAAATRQAFLAAAPQSAMIHYAGHAADDERMSGGRLQLADESQGSGSLRAAEIAQLRLDRTSLVVLAGCGTHRGPIGRVEGMPSLARAFLAAGVPTVVGTLWDVPDDRAASLFRLFHEHLRAGATPSIALAAAQRAMLRSNDPATSHPRVWAAVATVGIE